MVGNGDASQAKDGGIQPALVRPSRWWYWGAVGALVVAASWLGLGFLWASARVDNFQRVPVPGELELQLADPGRYLIYYEGPGAGQGVVLSSFDLTLTPADEGELVRLSRYGGSLSYNLGGEAGFAVFTFEIKEPRSLLLNLTYGGEGPLPSQVAVGTSIAPLIVGSVLGFLAWLIAGVVIALVVFLRRRRTRRAISGTPGPGLS